MIKAEMEVGKNSCIEFQLDTGASVNLLKERHVNSGNIQPSSKTLVMWNDTELKPKGECRVKVVNLNNGQKYASTSSSLKEIFIHCWVPQRFKRWVSSR